MNRTLPLVIILLFGLTLAPTVALAAEDPRFETHVSEPTLLPGQTQQLTVQLVNDAEEVDDSVTTAQNVKAEMRSGSTPFEIKSGTTLLGSMPDGAPVPVTFTLEAPQDIEPGTYDIPIRLEYEFDGDESESTTVHARVRIEDRAYFEIVETNSSLPEGGSGTANLTVKNIGTKPAHNATITTASSSPDIRFGQGSSASTFVSSWEPGEAKSVTYDVQATDGADKREYTLTTTIGYKDTFGTTRQSVQMDSGLPLLPAQEFAFEDVESTLRVGEKGRITATVRNDGPRSVDDAVVSLGQTAQTLTPDEREYGVGSLGVGETKTITLPITVAPTAEPSPRRLPFSVSYRNVEDDLQRTEDTYVTAQVSEKQEFAFEDLESTLRVGEKGRFTATVRNEGPRPVDDAVVSLGKTAEVLTPQQREYGLGSLGVGEAKTISLPITVASTAEPAPRRLAFTVSYQDAEEELQQTNERYVTAAVASERDRFGISQTTNTLRVGEEGTLGMTVTNNGESANDIVVSLLPTGQNVHPKETEYALGDLGGGETATVDFPIEISDDAEAVPRQFSVKVNYEDTDGDDLTTAPVNLRASIGDRQDRFVVDPVEASISAGQSGTIEVSITNNGEERVENVNAKIFADDPLSADDDEAFIDVLEPGETDSVIFSVGVAGTALQKAYPLSMDMQYEENGDTKLSDTYQIPVTATESEGREIPTTTVIGVVVLGILLVGGYVLYRRR